MNLSECLNDLVEIAREYDYARTNANRLEIKSVSETAQWLKGQAADRQRHRNWRDGFLGFLESLDDMLLRDVLAVMLIGRDKDYSAFENSEKRLLTAQRNADMYGLQGKHAMVRMLSKESRLHAHLTTGMKLINV